MTTHRSRLTRLEKNSRPSPAELAVPLNSIDFATNDRFLGLHLFPRQATVLKLMLLEIDLLTPYDLGVIERWSAGYTPTDMVDGRRWAGQQGIVPDILDRVRACADAGRWTFREMVLVLGRRASKSLLSSVVVTWQLWRLLMLDDPQAHFGLPTGKRIMLLTFSTTQLSASRDLFGDICARIRDSKCFEPFRDTITDTSITLFTPAQVRRGDRERGLSGLIEISASPTVASSARGPAAFMLVLDEAAHINGRGSTSSADEVRSAAKPAMAQFAKQSATLMPSTPWSMTGAFFDAFCRATAIDADNISLDPYAFALQLPSWDLYLDHELAETLPMWANGPTFAPPPAPFISDDELDALSRENPEAFEVEFGAQFISGVGAYFSQDTINRLFGPINGTPLQMQTRGDGSSDYVIHCDPSTSGANFAITIGHAVNVNARRHGYVDFIEVFRPQDFPEHRVDYNVVLPRLLALVEAFRPRALYFDNHNAEFFTDRLAPEIRTIGIATQVTKVNCTQIEKFARYERLKSRANLDEAHAPAHALAIEEARFLQQDGLRIGHPTSGPCQTDDIIDALSWLIDHLIGRNSTVHAALANLSPTGIPLPGPFDALTRENARRRRPSVPNPARFEHRPAYPYRYRRR